MADNQNQEQERPGAVEEVVSGAADTAATVANDVVDGAAEQVGQIEANIEDTVHEIGQNIAESLVGTLNNLLSGGEAKPPPPPDVTPEKLPADQAHQAIKEAAQEIEPPVTSPTLTTLHKQIEQAKRQIAKVKPAEFAQPQR